MRLSKRTVSCLLGISFLPILDGTFVAWSIDVPQNETAVRWGLVGLGGIVVQQIAPAIVKSTHSKLVACVGSTPEKTRAFARQFGVLGCYTSIEELAAADEVDAIFI